MKKVTVFQKINDLTLCAEFGPKAGSPYEFMKAEAVAGFINGTGRGRSTNVPREQLLLAQAAFAEKGLSLKAA